MLPAEGAQYMSFPMVILALVAGIVALWPDQSGYRYPTWARNALIAAVIGSGICVLVYVVFIIRVNVVAADEQEQHGNNSPEYLCLAVLTPLVMALSLLFLCLLAVDK